MSEKLFALVKSFINNEIAPQEFTELYPAAWKAERDNGELLADRAELSEALSSIFCIVDLYNSNNERESYELDEGHMRSQIGEIVQGLTSS